MMAEWPVLWSFRRCPYAMRARLALKSAAIKTELREITLKDKPAAFLAVSKAATVPALVTASGRIIDESRDIMFWALQQSGDPEGWLDCWHADKNAVTAFLDRLEGPFKDDLDKYKYAPRYTGYGSCDEDSFSVTHRARGSAFLDETEQRLCVTGFLSGPAAGLMDYAAFPFVRQFRIADPDWFDQQDWPCLHKWLQAFLHSPAFNAVMTKYQPWQAGQAPSWL